MNGPLRRNIAVFGSTGSIGTSTLDVVSGLGNPYRIFALAANRSADQLLQQRQVFRPEITVLTDEDVAKQLSWGVGRDAGDCKSGHGHLVEIAKDPRVDIVVAAIVGSAGLLSCLAAAEAGKRLALANKEALVVAGSLLTEAVQRGGAELLPVDSEHSAIFQALHSGKDRKEVRRIVLTASGGPLREWPKEKLDSATAKDALAHPTWQMGKKITIDSATMMNKALEVIEAKWLFGLRSDQIEVVIHPQSIIHSMVEFIDGSIVAQLSPPDMRLPIQYAITYPDRVYGKADSLDWSKSYQLDWSPADLDRYPALQLGFEVAANGGSTGAVLNAANEAAVSLFLEQRIAFTDIAKCCRAILDQHSYQSSPSLTDLLELDRWARKEVHVWANIPC